MSVLASHWSRLVAASVALSGLLSASVAAHAPEIVSLPNPSFEEGVYAVNRAPEGWTWRTRGRAVGRWETKGRNGRCISLENPDHDSMGVIDSDKFPIGPGHNYRLSFWHRARDPIPRRAEVWIYYGEKNANSGCRNFIVTTGRTWQERSVEFTTPNIRETFIRFILYRGSENSKFFVDDVKLEKLGPAKVTPETISWKMERTSVFKNIGGLFTRVDGPKTSRPRTTVLPVPTWKVVNTAQPRTPVIDGKVGEAEYLWASSVGPLRSLEDGRATEDRIWPSGSKSPAVRRPLGVPIW